MDVDVERVSEPATASTSTSTGEEATVPDSIRITRSGKVGAWVKKALEFFERHPDRPLVLYSPLADVSATTITRLITVVEIVKREYLKGRDVSGGEASGLHQYNQLLCEQRGEIAADGPDRRDALEHALEGRSHAKQSHALHMKITLSAKAIPGCGETYQTPAVRRMSRAAKARMRKRQRKDESGDAVPETEKA